MGFSQLGGLNREGFWGKRVQREHFSEMVKLINVSKDLFVQVHPSDNTALAIESGKAERWYIVDCAPRAFLYPGFSGTSPGRGF